MKHLPNSEESELTDFTMAVSESSLSKCWHQEDDTYWESYLNEPDQED